MFSRRFRAAAGPVVRAGRPALGWLNRLCFDRAGAVDQPYWMPRWAVRGRRRRRGAWLAMMADGRGKATRNERRGGMVVCVVLAMMPIGGLTGNRVASP